MDSEMGLGMPQGQTLSPVFQISNFLPKLCINIKAKAQLKKESHIRFPIHQVENF